MNRISTGSRFLLPFSGNEMSLPKCSLHLDNCVLCSSENMIVTKHPDSSHPHIGAFFRARVEQPPRCPDAPRGRKSGAFSAHQSYVTEAINDTRPCNGRRDTHAHARLAPTCARAMCCAHSNHTHTLYVYVIVIALVFVRARALARFCATHIAATCCTCCSRRAQKAATRNHGSSQGICMRRCLGATRTSHHACQSWPTIGINMK